MVSDKNMIRQKVIAIFAEQLSKPSTDIHPTESLEKLGVDSLDRVEIIMKLEEQFNVEISDEDAEKAQTIDAIVDYLYALLHKKA